MANLRRRSARLSKANTNQTPARKTPLTNARLGSVVERDETPDTVQQSIDEVLATPTTSRTVQEHLTQLNALRTPQTEPKAEQAEMNPKTAHRSTAKAPDSGLKLGFSDIKKNKKDDTPTRSAPRQGVPTASAFEFKFSSDAHLSRAAQQLMDNVREDAAKIKAQMVAERAAHGDQNTDTMFGGGRKIAQPKSRAGRFSDVHMAQFKKMDSIENHASAFRARPGFAAPTTQSLKRSPSKAGLDEVERPRTAGKGTPQHTRHIPPPVTGRPNSTSPFKSVPVTEHRNTPRMTKRARQFDHGDVSDSRPSAASSQQKSSTLYSPTKSSLARHSTTSLSPEKPSMIPRSSSTKAIRPSKSSNSLVASTASLPKSSTSKPLPPTPAQQSEPLYPTLPSSPLKSPAAAAKESNFTSKLPTLSGLRSILRGNKKPETIAERPGTPKRPNTAGPSDDSGKRVDFTPSVKSRHAVKLAADSPSPAKIRRDTPFKAPAPVFPYDSSAYTIIENEDQDWEDEDSEVTYPALPAVEQTGPVVHTFSAKSKEHNRRESKEFKSIFTTLHPARNEPATLTSINTGINMTNPESNANKIMRSPSSLRTKPSPSTIRRVRTSTTTQLVRPFEDNIRDVPRDLPGRKRRHDRSDGGTELGRDEDAKENRDLPELPAVPGGWDEDAADEVQDEGTSRGNKRVRRSAAIEKTTSAKSQAKKPSAAREAAAKNAKERKSRGVLSLSRLNMLSRPKSRG